MKLSSFVVAGLLFFSPGCNENASSVASIPSGQNSTEPACIVPELSYSWNDSTRFAYEIVPVAGSDYQGFQVTVSSVVRNEADRTYRKDGKTSAVFLLKQVSSNTAPSSPAQPVPMIFQEADPSKRNIRIIDDEPHVNRTLERLTLEHREAENDAEPKVRTLVSCEPRMVDEVWRAPASSGSNVVAPSRPSNMTSDQFIQLKYQHLAFCATNASACAPNEIHPDCEVATVAGGRTPLCVARGIVVQGREKRCGLTVNGYSFTTDEGTHVVNPTDLNEAIRNLGTAGTSTDPAPVLNLSGCGAGGMPYMAAPPQQ